MSFLSVIHAIDSGLKTGIAVAAPVAPVVSLIPGVGGIFGTVLTAVTAVEHLIPDADGAVKKDVATKIVTAAQPATDPAGLSESIDALVKALNALQAKQ